MAKQNVSVQFTEQGSENAGGKRFIKLNFIYRNNYHNMCMHAAKCCRSGLVFLHSVPTIVPGHLLPPSPTRAAPLVAEPPRPSRCILQWCWQRSEMDNNHPFLVRRIIFRGSYPPEGKSLWLLSAALQHGL